MVINVKITAVERDGGRVHVVDRQAVIETDRPAEVLERLKPDDIEKAIKKIIEQ